MKPKSNDNKPLFRRHQGLDIEMRRRAEVARDAGDQDEAKRWHYRADFLAKRRVLFDVDNEYAATRAMLVDADEMIANEAGGYKFNFEDEVDWFLNEKGTSIEPATRGQLIDRVPGENGYEYRTQLLRTFELIEDELHTTFAGQNFKEDETSTRQLRNILQEKIRAEFGTLPPSKENEIAEIAIELYSLAQGRLDYYPVQLAVGGSPVEWISKLLKYIQESGDLSWMFYLGYKETPLHEVEIYDVHHWLHDKIHHAHGKPSALNKLHNIEEMAEGMELLLRTVAPLRQRRGVPKRGRWETIRPPYPTLLDFFWRDRQRRLQMNISIENWSSTRGKFADFWRTVWGPLPNPEKVKSRIRSGNPEKHEQGRLDYRNELVEAMHVLFTSKISGLKGNMLLDWDQVADATVAYLDRMFKTYALVDAEPLGMRLLHGKILDQIKNDYGNLSSAGDVTWDFDDLSSNEEIEVRVGGAIEKRKKVKKGDVVTFYSFLRLQLDPKIPGNRERLKPEVQGNQEHAEGSIEAYPMTNLRWRLFKLKHPTFYHGARLLGRSAEKQKEVPKEDQK